MKKPVLDILLKKFPASEYALMAEVRDQAVFNASRAADFLVMGLWPSRGLDMIGIERKSYRSDWLGELKKPEKAENIYQYCDRWYLLTDGENIAKIEEIPVNWGWMHINEKGKLNVYKEAPKLVPVTISKSFLACLLKRASDKKGWVTIESIGERLNESKELGKIDSDRENKRMIDIHNKLVNDVKDFEEITGIKLLNTRWQHDGKKIGEAVKFILSGGINDIKQSMTSIKNYHLAIGKKIDEFELLEDIK